MSDYKLVPVEPTAEMMATGGIEMGARDEDARTVWKAMIAAAPAVQGEPVAWRLRTPEGRSEYRPPQLPAAWQPCPESIREGAPYDDPVFEALCREHEIWGTPAAAQCAVFWEAGKRVAEQKPDPDYIEYEILRRAMSNMGLAARDARRAAHRKQEGNHDNQ